MSYFLDTDVFTLAHRGSYGLRERIVAARGATEVAVTRVTDVEVLQGRFDALVKAADGAALLRAQDALRSSEVYLATFRVVPFDPAAVAHFDRLRDEKAARRVRRKDLLIACICLAHDATLVTRNTKDFVAVAGLRVENWTD